MKRQRKNIYKTAATIGLWMGLSITAVTVTSCVTDSMGECPEEEHTGRYYMTLSVQQPKTTGTRSVTDENGDSNETPVAGSSNENRLETANVYFCDENDEYILSFTSDYYVEPGSNQTATLHYYLGSDISQFEKLIGKTIRIYVVGNITDKSGNMIYTPQFAGGSDSRKMAEAKFKISDVASRPIGDFGNNGQIMPLVSADYLEITIEDNDGLTPAEILNALFSEKSGNTLTWYVNDPNRNIIPLERAVGRFEYRGNVTQEIEEGELKLSENFIYPIEGSGVKVKLASLTPFNVNTESYLFRHTSAGDETSWGGANTVRIFGKENGKTPEFQGYNWIASPWWKNGTPALLNIFKVGESVYTIDDALVDEAAGNIDLETLRNREVSEPLVMESGLYKGGYHPWCYVSENTLYSTALMTDAEVAKYATGVIFKFAVLDEDGVEITCQGEKTPKSKMAQEINWSKESGKSDWLEITDFNTGGWVQLEPEDGKYYLTYMACIKHNVVSGGIGPMYYGVVRNNTYQISINKLSGLPLPKEPRTLFLEMEVNVLDWNKRDVSMDF